jgi:hypothetical protein
MTHRRVRIAGAACLALLASVALPARQGLDPYVVRTRLIDYLDGYERQLSTLIAEERFTQWPAQRRQVDRNYGPTDSFVRDATRARTMVSDVAFVSLPGNAGWLGYRDVRTVNGRLVRRSGPALADLLTTDSGDARERAMALLLEGARHNLGAPRTINLPSLPLELLHRRNQGRFVIVDADTDRAGRCAAVRLDLEETVRPTLIQRPEGGDMPSRVSAWVEPSSGRLCRADARSKDAQLGAWFEAVVQVEFEPDAALGLTVPVRLHEVFFDPPRAKGEGEATYTNYRRFSTAARIVPQP